MSYAVTLRGGRLALGAAASFSATLNVATRFSSSVASGKTPDPLPACELVFSDPGARKCCAAVKLTGASIEKKAKDIAACGSKATADALVPCKDVADTGIGYVDDAIVECCEWVKRSDGSLEEKAKGVGECVAKGIARGAGASVGAAVGVALCAATGVGATVSYFCGMAGGIIGGAIGGFLYDLISGYSAGQLGAGLVAGALCGVVSGGALALACGIAAAELVGWLSDTVGPVLEGIFNPSAAKDREMAARAAYHEAIEANQLTCFAATERYRRAWGLGIHSLKELYLKAFKTTAWQEQAKKLLGFGFTYSDLASALVKAGAPSQRYVGVAKGTRGCFPDPAWECANCGEIDYAYTGSRKPRSDSEKIIAGIVASAADSTEKMASIRAAIWSDDVVAAWTIDRKPPPWSDICPFSLERFYLEERTKALGAKPTRQQVTAWERKVAPILGQLAEVGFALFQQALTIVSAQITTVAASLKKQELLAAAEKSSRDQLAARIAKAASNAEIAAELARTGTAAEAKRAVVRAMQQCDIAEAAYKRLSYEQYTATATTPVTQLKAAAASLKRARAARDNAPRFAAQTARKRLLLGAAVGAGAIGAAYYFTR